MVTYWSETFPQANGQPWDASKWVDGSPAASSALRTAQNGWGRMRCPAGYAPMPVRAAVTPPMDVEMVGTFRVNSIDVYPRFYLRASPGIDELRGYYVEPTMGGTVFGTHRNGSQASRYGGTDTVSTKRNLTTATEVGFTFSPNITYHFKFLTLDFITGVTTESGQTTWSGGVGVAAKFWPNGAAEPADYQVEVIDPLASGPFVEQTADAYAAGVRVTGGGNSLRLELDNLALWDPYDTAVTPVPAPVTDRVQVWTGAAWRAVIPQVWTGSGWRAAPVTRM